MQHQIIQFKLADMATRIEACTIALPESGMGKRQRHGLYTQLFHGKSICIETAMWAAVEAVQIHGGYGYVKEYHVERLMRDAKITQIYEGTREVQRIVISRGILS